MVNRPGARLGVCLSPGPWALLFPVLAVEKELRLRLHKSKDLQQHLVGRLAVALLLRLKEATGAAASSSAAHRTLAPIWREGELKVWANIICKLSRGLASTHLALHTGQQEEEHGGNQDFTLGIHVVFCEP